MKKKGLSLSWIFCGRCWGLCGTHSLWGHLPTAGEILEDGYRRRLMELAVKNAPK